MNILSYLRHQSKLQYILLDMIQLEMSMKELGTYNDKDLVGNSNSYSVQMEYIKL